MGPNPETHPRIIFPSIEVARQASPFFIDENEIGPWLSSPDLNLWSKGTVQMSSRNAIHIPSLEPTGEKISANIIERFCQRAATLRLDQMRLATGYWTLTSTGELQVEEVRIVFSEKAFSPIILHQLADEIIRATSQEAIAIEISGRVEQYFRENGSS